MNNLILDAQNIHKSFTDGKATVDVIRGLSLQVKAGEFVSIVGSSGSGKSTLLHVLGGLDRPTSGQVMVNGRRFDTLSEAERGYVRNEHLGFVYQFHHLICRAHPGTSRMVFWCSRPCVYAGQVCRHFFYEICGST